jgi:hypothetical protein
MSWDPDDPRLDELPTALAANLANRALMEAQADFFSTPDAIPRDELINNHRADETPTLTRLTALIEEKLRRHLSGWLMGRTSSGRPGGPVTGCSRGRPRACCTAAAACSVR